MKILYLTFFESVTRNGIYKSQVQELLCRLREEHGDEFEFTHVAICPSIIVGKRDILCPFLSERRDVEAVLEEYRAHGVEASVLYVPLVILKRWMSHPSLPLLSLIFALCFPALLVRSVRKQFDVIHCRSYVATAFAVALKMFFRNAKVIFDPRGFYPEEGVVHGRWTESSVSFRLWKRIEKFLIRRSDKVISLSETFSEHINKIDPLADCSLIYAGADLSQFRRDPQVRDIKREQLGLQGKTVFVYNGSLGTWHDPVLLGRIARNLCLQIPGSKFLVVSRYSESKLREIFTAQGLQEQDFLIAAADPNQVPSYLWCGDFGIVPLREIGHCAAINVVAETMIGLKVAEYLASGLPILVNQNIRGIRSLIREYPIGVYFASDHLENLGDAVRQIRARPAEYAAGCESVANNFLSLQHAVQSYRKVYASFGPDLPGKQPAKAASQRTMWTPEP